MYSPRRDIIIPALTFRFLGNTDHVEGARNGDVICNNQTGYNEVHLDGEWIPLGNSEPSDNHRIIENVRCTCERCGAPMHITETMIRLGVAQCEYCECSQSIYE